MTSSAPAAEPQKLVIVLTANANTDKSTVAFTIANAALSSGKQVGVFLASDGVEMGREGACEMTAVRPFQPVADLIDSFVDAGGTLWACAPCTAHRGFREGEMLDGALVTGAAPMLDWVSAGASTLCF